LARLDESIAAFNQRFIFPRPFAMKIIKINLWNQGSDHLVLKYTHDPVARQQNFENRTDINSTKILKQLLSVLNNILEL
jgi:hypothetical protein